MGSVRAVAFDERVCRTVVRQFPSSACLKFWNYLYRELFVEF